MRCCFLLAAAVVKCCLPCCLSFSSAAEFPDTSRMNVLFINIEDCNASAWGCYGNQICKTPNLDRLAAAGVRFDAAYCQGICCGPSRASFLTGLRPHTTRVFGNSTIPLGESLPPGTLTMPELFKNRGFYLANVAKLFHGNTGLKQSRCFDRLERCHKPADWQPGSILQFPPVPRQTIQYPKRPAPGADRAAMKEFYELRKQFSSRWGDSGVAESQEADFRSARVASALLKEFAKDKRHFFLSLGSLRTHTPLLCPKKYVAMYDPAKIPLPAAPPENDRNVPGVATNFGRSHDVHPNREQAREVVAAYYACLTFLDAQLGTVLDTLEEQGLADKTIVVCFSDHGFHLGEHGIWSKYTMFEQTTRIPLVVRVPGAPGNGKVCREIVELVDLLPTLGELAGLDLPENLEGTSFVPLLIEPEQPWKSAAFTVGLKEEVLSLRTKQYHYGERPYKGEKVIELYDLAKDPWETVNLGNDPAYAAKRKELADLLRTGWKAALPPKK